MTGRPHGKLGLVAAALVLSILTPAGGGAGAGAAEPTCPTPGAGWRRVAGVDRFETAAALLAGAAPTAPVYVAGGDGISDALAAAPAAAAGGGGLLFVDRDTVPAATRAALAATRPPIVVVGGSRVVSPDVVRELARISGGPIEQVAGADRYATAVALARRVTGDTVLLAGGDGIADALAAGATGRPVLMTGRDALPPVVAAELARRKPATILLVGGTAALSAAVEAAAGAAAPGAQVRRVAGADRYATAAALAPRTGPAVYIASGTSFADALAAGPVAARRKGALLLVPPTGTPSAEVAALAGRADAELVAVGGTAAVPDAVITALRPARVACLQGGSSIPIGGQVPFTVQLTAPAPPGGTRVMLLVDRAGVTSPAFVDVPAGATSATFTVTADPGVSGPTTVRASAGGATVELPVSAGAFPPGLWARPTISSFTASPTVRLSGEPTKLSWSVVAGACTITPDVGTVPCTGTTTITPGSTKTYTLAATIGIPDAPASLSTVTITVPTRTTTAYAVYNGSGANGTVGQLAIDDSGGVTQVGTALAAGNDPSELVVDPLGRFVFVSDVSADQIHQYRIGSGGALTANGAFTIGSNVNPRGMVVDPSGRWLYAAYQGTDQVQAFTIAGDGTLATNGGSLGVGSQPLMPVIDPLGRFLYAPSAGATTTFVFRVNADGTLTAGTTYTDPLGTARTMAVDPTGRIGLLSITSNNRIRTVAIDQTTGALSGLSLQFSDQSPAWAGFDPLGRYLYSLHTNDNTLESFRVNGDGTLTSLNELSSPAASNLVVDASGRYVLTTDTTDFVRRYAIGSDGSLTFLGASPVGDDPKQLAILR